MNKIGGGDAICRSCLSEKEQLLNPYTEYDPVNELKYVDEYYKCTNILINNTDSLPKMLCQDCIYELQMVYQFQQRAKQSNDALLKCASSSIKNYKKEVSNQNNEGLRVQTEHGYSFISISPCTESQEMTPKYLEWNRNEQITIKRTDTNEYVISMDGPPCITSNQNDQEKYSVLEVDMNEELLFNCSKCDDGFESEVLLDAHIIRKHPPICTGPLRIDNDIISKEFKQNVTNKIDFVTEQFLCSICGITFTEQTILDEHFTSFHQDEQDGTVDYNNKCDVTNARKKTPKIPNYLCSICGKNFMTNQRLRIHTYTHTGERNFDCEVCSKKFATEFRLRSHRRTHTGERPYECTVCKLRFAQANALKCHKRVHTGEKPYECPYCSKKFSQNTILKTHLTLHTGKTIQCPDCDKKFSRASYLILHKREHTGEKPYACDRCPNRYKQKSHLDRHMDNHNGVKYKCMICSKEYSKQHSLKMHMSTHTNKKLFNCPHCTAAFSRNDRYKSHLKLRHVETIE